MSVFKAREWWVTKIGDDEEVDGQSMAVGNVDNEAGGTDKIVVGSMKGVLRIYKPSSRDFKPEDQKLEQPLGAPVLQVAIGVFGSHSQKDLQLAVLHPRRLAVYGVTAVPVNENSTDTFFQLSLLYKHSLQRSAYNFTYGSFGNQQGKQFICVQSLDGELSFFEHERYAFNAFLPNFLVPGPICYVPGIDSFVTVNAQFECECFKYNSLLSSSTGNMTAQEEKDKPNKRARSEWATNLGESAAMITVAKHSSGLTGSQADIIIMGERTLFWLQEGGTIRTHKRLDFFPLCVKPYNISASASGANQNLIVGTEKGHIMIYGQNLQLLWAASLDFVPVSLEVMKVGSLGGLVVSLSDDGNLCLSYMGTDPPSQVVNTNKKALNYDNMDVEHRQLLSVIREATSGTKTEPTDRLVITAQMPNVLDPGTEDRGWEEMAITAKIFLSYTGSEEISDVSVTVSVPDPFKCGMQSSDRFGGGADSDVSTTIVPSIGGSSTPRTITVTFGLKSSAVPTETIASIAAIYQTKNGEPRTVTSTVRMPMILCCKIVPPIKREGFKITVDSNRQPPSLPSLFEDLVSLSGTGAAQTNVMTFMYHCSVDVTIMVSSKNTGRFRILAGSMEHIWLIAKELVDRLNFHFNVKSPQKDEAPFEVSFADELQDPLGAYFELMDTHFAARQTLVETQEELEKASTQFRNIEKRLLVRFKDRNPAPINELDTILDISHKRIADLGDQGQKQQETLAKAAQSLSAGTRLMLFVVKLNFGLDESTYQILEDHWSPTVVDTPTQGWEETTEMSLGLLLKTSLAKGGGKDTSSLPQGAPPPLKDLVKLKKHMATVCERLAAR